VATAWIEIGRKLHTSLNILMTSYQRKPVLLCSLLLLFSATAVFIKLNHATMKTTYQTPAIVNYPIHYRKIEIDSLQIFYREAGPANAPVILLMHGFPSSSFMFRNLINELKDRYHIIAPDYPGFGQSSIPSLSEFEYSFDNLSKIMERLVDKLGIKSFSMYIQDYGAPVGLRLISRRPELLQCLIVQNGNAYEEGLGEAWAPLKAIWTDPHNEVKKKKVMEFMNLEGTKFQYVEGVSDSSVISPDTYTIDQFLLDRSDSKQIQYQLLYDYRNNIKDYPVFHKLFREKQPPTLVVWGENDVFFLKKGALAYGRDIKNIEFNFYKTGHFALEEYHEEIAAKIDSFLQRNL
jgi:pimeloyl-ACP methyl ester carboxylesterase